MLTNVIAELIVERIVASKLKWDQKFCFGAASADGPSSWRCSCPGVTVTTDLSTLRG